MRALPLRFTSIALSVGLGFGLTACEGETISQDVGEADTGPDGGVAIEDTGPRPDLGPLTVDMGSLDLGPRDPNTLFEGEPRVNGLKTYVHIRGTYTSTMPPIIIMGTGTQMGGIPGFYGSYGVSLGHEYLPEQLDFLLEGRTMAYFDLRATGQSSHGVIGSSSVTPNAHVEHLRDFVDWVLDKDEVSATEVDLIGHGYGGGIAALYAAVNPEKISRMVLITPMATNISQFVDSVITHNARLSGSDRELLDLITREPECLGNNSMCTLEIWRIFGPKSMCRENEALLRDMTFMHADFRTFSQVRLSLQEDEYDWAPMLSNITVPTTVISGPCDPAPEAIALTYSSTIAGAVHHVIPNSGHFPMVENPVEFQRVLSGTMNYP